MRTKFGRAVLALAPIILVAMTFAQTAGSAEAIRIMNFPARPETSTSIVALCDSSGGPACVTGTVDAWGLTTGVSGHARIGGSEQWPDAANIDAFHVQNPAAVSEPAALAIFGIGFLVFGAALRWRKTARRRGRVDALRISTNKLGWRNTLTRSFSRTR